MPVKKSESKVEKTTSSLRATAKQSQTKKEIATKPVISRNALSVPVYSLAGKEAGTLSLPKEIFGQKVNKALLAQAIRVYMSNQKHFTASTKTRGEVRGSTAKIYRQKGTGRARHGAKTAPIFVGGGIVFGPKPREVKLEFPKKMRKAALLAALSDKAGDQGILGVSGLEKASGKTKEMAEFMYKVSSIKYKGEDKNKKISALIMTGEKMDNVVRGVRNMSGVDVLPANQINAYEVLRHQMLIITKEAVERISVKESSKS